MFQSWSLPRYEYGNFLANEEHIQVIFSYFVFLSEFENTVNIFDYPKSTHVPSFQLPFFILAN